MDSAWISQSIKFSPPDPRAKIAISPGWGFLPKSQINKSPDKILAEGISQVKNGRGPRGQMFPLNGHLNTVAKGTDIRILVLVNTVDGDTDSTARLEIDARNAYLKVTELNDTNATA